MRNFVKSTILNYIGILKLQFWNILEKQYLHEALFDNNHQEQFCKITAIKGDIKLHEDSWNTPVKIF